jgi:hypothetical protein
MSAVAYSAEPDVSALCDELEQLVHRGPGDKPVLLRRVKDAIHVLEIVCSTNGAGARLSYLSFSFEEWFSVARWCVYGRGGKRLRSRLHSEIEAVRRDLVTATDEESSTGTRGGGSRSAASSLRDVET